MLFIHQASSGEETGSTLKASSKPSLHQSSEPVTELSANRKESQPPPVISADQVMLDFGELKFIDANHLLERCNEVSVSSGTPVEFDLSGDSDSDTECQDKDALLMRELESLQEKQLQVAAPAPNVVKPGMTDQVVMAALAVMSRGVSARLEVPCNAPRVTQTADTTPERETVFLDLRRKKDEATEQVWTFIATLKELFLQSAGSSVKLINSGLPERLHLVQSGVRSPNWRSVIFAVMGGAGEGDGSSVTSCRFGSASIWNISVGRSGGLQYT